MLFGGNAYVNDVDGLNSMIKQTFAQPEVDEPSAVRLKIQDEEKEKKVADAPQVTEWKDEYEGALEYSIFGWFRYSNPTLAKDNNLFLRLTNNEPAYRKEFG